MDPKLGFFVRPDSLDFRDRIFQPTLVEVPSEIPLSLYRQCNVPVLNQLGARVSGRANVRKTLRASAAAAQPHSTAWACTGFALSTVVHYLLRRRTTHADHTIVSEAMLFEMARRYDDYTGEQYLGSSARGAMRGWYLHGVCSRELWPFRQGRQDRRLTAVRAADAGTRPLGAYFRVNHKDLVAMHCALAEVGVLYAVINVHKGWLAVKKKDGEIPPSDDTLGSHAVAIVAYDRCGFWIQNSWGTDWGSGGFAHLRYDDWLKNGVDTWVARLGVPTFLGEPSSAAQINASGSTSAKPHVVRHLRQHLVRIHPDGHLQSNDSYGTSVQDLDTIFEEDFPKATGSWKKKRLLLMASGGLGSLDATVQRVADYRASLMGQGIYPLVFVWRTGFWDTISAVLRRALSERQHDSIAGPHTDFMLDRLDDGLEPMARQEGGKLHWDDLKRTARQATALADGGVRLTLDRVARLVEHDPSVEVHLVGHSAGAILLAPAVQLLTSEGKITSGPMKGRQGLGVPVQSCGLWAPACTTDLFHHTYFDAIAARRIRRFLLITLTEQAEAADNVGGIYRKSVLHLIANALEEEPRVPDELDGTEIMGMEKFVKRHDAARPGYVEFLRLARRTSVTWLLSPAPLMEDPGQAMPVATRRHGDFDDDPGTLMATLSLILNRQPKDVRLAILRSASSAKRLRQSL